MVTLNLNIDLGVYLDTFVCMWFNQYNLERITNYSMFSSPQ